MTKQEAGKAGKLQAQAFIAVNDALANLEALEKQEPLFGLFAADKVRLENALTALSRR